MALISAIPLAWKVAAGAILLVLLGALCAGLYAKGRADEAAICKASVAQAVAKQAADDQALSSKLLDQQAAALAIVHAQSSAALQKVANAPITKTCGPVQSDASRSVRDLIRGGAAAP